MIRTTNHKKLIEYHKYSNLPIINGLSNISHPCQILADIMSYNEKRGSIDMWLGHLIHLIFTCETISILPNLKKNYDLLLIDGGGLTTFDEFLIIFPRIKKYIFLDDIDGVKGKKIFEFLNKQQNYNLVFNSSTRQSCVFKKSK